MKTELAQLERSTSSADVRPARNCDRWFIAALLLVQSALLARSAWVHSPTIDEPAHLAAGVAHWQTGSFRPYCVNPHLTRTVAAAPVVLSGIPYDAWTMPDGEQSLRLEFAMADDLIEACGTDIFWYTSVARWACIPFSLLGGLVCYLWANAAYGRWPARMALLLWTFFPEILGHGALITSDVSAAALGVTAGFTFWRWLERPTWAAAALAGVCLGLALLTKLTWIALFGLWPIAWVASRILNRADARTSWTVSGGQLAVILLAGLLLLNAGYGFQGSLRRLGEFRFWSVALGGGERPAVGGPPANRFQETWLGDLRVPLPADYVKGTDLQKRDFEDWRPTYLAQDAYPDGVWYFYFYAAAVKLPLGFWLLLWMRMLMRGSVGSRNTTFLVLGVPVFLLITASMMQELTYFRYLMPIWPFLFVWTSGVAREFPERSRVYRAAVAAPCAWAVWAGLWYFPHNLSYFNEAAGGPSNGDAHLIDSHIDWGQDLLLLRDWQRTHPEARPLHVACAGFVDPQLAGIDSRDLGETLGLTSWTRREALTPGWYAVSVHALRGGRVHSFPEEGESRSYSGTQLIGFHEYEPIDRVGYTLYVYQIEADTVLDPTDP